MHNPDRINRIDGTVTRLAMRALMLGPFDFVLVRSASGRSMYFTVWAWDWALLHLEWGEKEEF